MPPLKVTLQWSFLEINELPSFSTPNTLYVENSSYVTTLSASDPEGEMSGILSPEEWIKISLKLIQ